MILHQRRQLGELGLDLGILLDLDGVNAMADHPSRRRATDGLAEQQMAPLQQLGSRLVVLATRRTMGLLPDRETTNIHQLRAMLIELIDEKQRAGPEVAIDQQAITGGKRHP